MLILVVEVHDAQRGDAILRPASRQAQLPACVRATVAPADRASVVAAFDKDAGGVRIQHDVVAADMCAERRRADRTRAAEAQLGVVRSDSDQVGIPVRIHLHPADEEDPLLPMPDVRETVSRVAVRLRPAHDSVVPGERRQRQAVQMRHVHARAEEDQVHVRAVHEMSQAYRRLDDRHGNADHQVFLVLQVARQENGHHLLGGNIAGHGRVFHCARG